MFTSCCGTEETRARRPSWKEYSGREYGEEGYQFGDLLIRPAAVSFKTAFRRISQQDPLNASDLRTKRLEKHMQELFQLHDLNGNNVLEEKELVQLNVKVKMLHHGKDIDRAAVKREFKTLFRSKLDRKGKPVPFRTFRHYMFEVLDGLDSNVTAQEMILEQLAAEARSARAIFREPSFQSLADLDFLPFVAPELVPACPYQNERLQLQQARLLEGYSSGLDAEGLQLRPPAEHRFPSHHAMGL